MSTNESYLPGVVHLPGAYKIPTILFLKGVHLSQFKPIEDLATEYFSRNENQSNSVETIVIKGNSDNITYGKIPPIFTTLEKWHIENVKCYYTDILLNGKYPFIPLGITYINKITHDELNMLDIKKLNLSETPQEKPKRGKKQLNTTTTANKVATVSNNTVNNTKTLEIRTFGVFYNFNIAAKFIEQSDWTEQEKWEKMEMLKKLHKIWYNKEMEFQQVPSKYKLLCYGGDLTIEEYLS